MAIDEALRKRREEICVGHMKAEDAHDFDTAIGKFARPRYDIIPTGEVYDGADALHRLMNDNVTGFPDFFYRVDKLHHADDAIIVEGRFTGTHLGTWRGLPATGRRVDYPMLLVFPFDGEDMLGEQVYFDLNTALHQLGMAFDPTTTLGRLGIGLSHPVNLAKAFVRRFGRRQGG
jgi:steroid delta-isomerase-like uncharacterized protein